MIRLIQVVCGCGEKSPAARDPMQNNTPNDADAWNTAHFDATGVRDHRRWTLERGAGRMYRF